MDTINDLFPEDPQVVYVVMWESFQEGNGCAGGDLYMSLSDSKARMYLRTYGESSQDLVWDDENDMYIYRDEYEWEKAYIVERPLDEEL